MVLENTRIGRKLIVLVGGSIAVFLFILGALAVTNFAGLIRGQTLAEAQGVVQEGAVHMGSFLARHGQISETMLHNPGLVEWMAGRSSRDQDYANDPEFLHVVGFFDNIVAGSDTVIAAFFGVDRSGEYFGDRQESRPFGRYDPDDYIMHKRPWWTEAVALDRLYVASTTQDTRTKDVIVTIQSAVRQNGRLVGVGGVDLLINTLRDEVIELRHGDDGHAFLVDSVGELIAFSDLELPDGFMLTDVEELESDASGFADLLEELKRGDGDPPKVHFRGVDWLILSAPVQLSSPQVNWTLGMLVPETAILEPMRWPILGGSFAILLTIACICGLTLGVSRAIVTAPIQRLAERFHDIAEGRGDLTRRVEVAGRDEIGRLGSSFNTFVAEIQTDVASIATQAESLSHSSGRLSEYSEHLMANADGTASRAELVSAAADQVSSNIQTVATATEELNANTREISAGTLDAARVAGEAVAIADTTARVFSELGESRARIAGVVHVIYAIAEQTTLLELSATIEAARAGSAGKGFAVVAEEVKTLAGETAKATEVISSAAESIEMQTETARESIAEVADIVHSISDQYECFRGPSNTLLSVPFKQVHLIECHPF